jgi:hypothetical protein
MSVNAFDDPAAFDRNFPKESSNKKLSRNICYGQHTFWKFSCTKKKHVLTKVREAGEIVWVVEVPDVDVHGCSAPRM